MKSLTLNEMSQVIGGNTSMAVIGGIACAVSTLWPIGTLIAGPTCAGMIIGMIVD
jgi:bacteriocin-like protein